MPICVEFMSLRFRTEQLTFVTDICGTIDEHLWRRQLTTLGLTVPQQNHLIQKWMKATIEGTYSVVNRVQDTIVHPWCASPLPWRQFKVSRVSPEKEKKRKRNGCENRQNAVLLIIVLNPHPRLSYGLHTHFCNRILKWHTPTMTCWKRRRSCSSHELPWKEAQQGLSNAEWH
jgi:hypothetical protein